jgi:hypothetical protein
MIEYKVKVYDGDIKHWYLNDKLHREDGPAFESTDGSKYWYLNGELHREDGPAIEYVSGFKSWWLNGKKVTEEEHKATMNFVEEMTMEEICKVLGKNVKVIK